MIPIDRFHALPSTQPSSIRDGILAILQAHRGYALTTRELADYFDLFRDHRLTYNDRKFSRILERLVQDGIIQRRTIGWLYCFAIEPTIDADERA